MVWTANMLITGDDVGKVSILQLQNFIVSTFKNVIFNGNCLNK